MIDGSNDISLFFLASSYNKFILERLTVPRTNSDFINKLVKSRKALRTPERQEGRLPHSTANTDFKCDE